MPHMATLAGCIVAGCYQLLHVCTSSVISHIVIVTFVIVDNAVTYHHHFGSSNVNTSVSYNISHRYGWLVGKAIIIIITPGWPQSLAGTQLLRPQPLPLYYRSLAGLSQPPFGWLALLVIVLVVAVGWLWLASPATPLAVLLHTKPRL
ncbi:hypothetical protein NPIL_79521 [Nephila pilipes]|uniref:Uncharacterized protein n=1 Tax=Nephila pilipes TaxID=299642 RepID=A0A8X6PPI9_NEPPI|nr:hypothetical protein NPIL_79521 [Nephila pilipes]